MKTRLWVVHFLLFVILLAGALLGLTRAQVYFVDRIATHRVNVENSDMQAHEAQETEKKLGYLNKNGDKLKQYREAWQNRSKTYGTKEAILEILRAATAQYSLQMVEGGDANRVIENNAKDFRIMWHFTGKAPKAMAWLATMQETIDPILFESIRVTSVTEQLVDVRCEAVVRIH